MNPHISDLLQFLESIPLEEYLFISITSILTFNLLTSYYRPFRFQLTAAVFFLLWIIRFIGGFDYHLLITSGNPLPFTRILIPVCSLIFFCFLLYEKKQEWVTIRISVILSLGVLAITLLLF
jgi:hypothetical protein